MSIVVNNLTKKFGSQRAVDNITFEVKTGEILGFLGPNGAGKTTTMKILTCFMAPSDGDAKVNDLSILESQDEIKKKITCYEVNEASIITPMNSFPLCSMNFRKYSDFGHHFNPALKILTGRRIIDISSFRSYYLR